MLPKGTYAGFAEYSRRAGDYAVAMAVTTYRLKNGVMSDLHVAVGGAEACPRRIAEAERMLIGRPPNLGTFQSAAHAVIKAVRPLDDANVERFVNMLRRFSDRTQFIVVTHNKKTMEIAESLYGVTMQEAGVSKLVSVRFHAPERNGGNGNGNGKRSRAAAVSGGRRK